MGSGIKEKEFKPDTGMVQILQDNVDVWTGAVLRAKEYLRIEELKLKRAKKKLDTYVKTGKLLSEEELRK
ncbi:hypothetical protein [Serratia sp. (in: enterobacteria)]|uniref:hypothetical protein n=1 Tax=Serratia sp. (in: enterobacteria) TaxID=616 RepID=UPI003989B022